MIYTEDIIKRIMRKHKKIQKRINYISYIFIILIVVLASYIGYMKCIKNQANISLFGYRQYMVATGSMEPQYSIGDLIITKDISNQQINVGDIISYVPINATETITHRVIEVVEKDGKDYYKTKGDNNNCEDPELVEANQIQGKLVFKISKFGTIVAKLLTKTGITICIIIIIISYLREINKEEKIIARETARKLYNIPKYKENKD